MQFEEIDLNKGLSVDELEHLIGARDYREFLNTRNELYRERNMKEHPPSRAEALAADVGAPQPDQAPDPGGRQEDHAWAAPSVREVPFVVESSQGGERQ